MTMPSLVLNRFESLSNELLLDIFEYLDAYSLYQAFYGLNDRINHLIQSTQLHIEYNAKQDTKLDFEMLLKLIKPSQIHMISYYNDINKTHNMISSTNENLNLIRLHDITLNSINTIFQHISRRNRIKCLSIKEKRDYRIERNRSCLNLVFDEYASQLTSLTNLSISSSDCRRIATFPTTSARLSKLRRLSISNCSWTTDFLEFLQNNAPNLKSLHFIELYNSFTLSPGLVLKNINELHINHSNNFNYLQSILSMFPSLCRLHVDQNCRQKSAIISGAQWQRLIELYLPSLKQLTIDYGNGIDEDILETFYIGEFWTTKKVKVKMTMNKTKSRYPLINIIYFGRPWRFKYFDNLNL